MKHHVPCLVYTVLCDLYISVMAAWLLNGLAGSVDFMMSEV